MVNELDVVCFDVSTMGFVVGWSLDERGKFQRLKAADDAGCFGGAGLREGSVEHKVECLRRLAGAVMGSQDGSFPD